MVNALIKVNHIRFKKRKEKKNKSKRPIASSSLGSSTHGINRTVGLKFVNHVSHHVTCHISFKSYVSISRRVFEQRCKVQIFQNCKSSIGLLLLKRRESLFVV